MAKSTFITLLATITLFAALVSAMAVTGGEMFFKVHPSLPSLQSLGITPNQLYDIALNQTSNAIQSRDDTTLRRFATYNPRCDANPCSPAGVSTTASCAAYFRLVGSSVIAVDKNAQILCQAGPFNGDPQAHVVGYAISADPKKTDPTASSFARDVVGGVDWVTNNCPHNACSSSEDCGMAGSAVATGNGDFIVHVVGSGQC